MQDQFLGLVILRNLLGLFYCSENKNWKYLSLKGQKNLCCTVVSSFWEAYDPKLRGELEEESSNKYILLEVF
jgi:hypothetical protein